MSQTRKIKLIPFYRYCSWMSYRIAAPGPFLIHTAEDYLRGHRVSLVGGMELVGFFLFRCYYTDDHWLWRFSTNNVFDQVDYDFLCAEWRYSPVDAVRCRPGCVGLAYLFSANSKCCIR